MAFSPETGWTEISEAVFFHAEHRPGATALIEGEERLTYAALAPLVAAAAHYAYGVGVRPRDVVGVVMAGNIDHVILSLGLIRLGATPLEVPMPLPGQGPVQPLQPFGIRFAFVATGAPPPDVPIAHVIAPGWRRSLTVGFDKRRGTGDPDREFYLSLTSGSTGQSKAIVTTRRQWQARYRTARKLFPTLLDRERPPQLVVVGGLAFSAFFFFLTNHLFVGGPVVLMTGAHDPDRLAAAVNQWDDAAMLISPPLAREFLARAPQNGVLFPKMRALFVGAAPFFADEKRAVQARLCRNSYEVYGSAASGFLSRLSPEELAAHASSVGRPVEDAEIEIVDKEGTRLPPGRTGHIRVRGPAISQGFYGPHAGETTGSEGFRDGWYYPGDLGSIAPDGFLSLQGRLPDLIQRRGVEIFPPELEEIYLAHPMVQEAAVVGARLAPDSPDQAIVAFVVPRPGLNPEDLAQHCRRLIPPERFPDQSVALPELPKTGNGKLDRPRLAAMAVQILRDAAAAAGPAR